MAHQNSVQTVKTASGPVEVVIRLYREDNGKYTVDVYASKYFIKADKMIPTEEEAIRVYDFFRREFNLE